MAMILGPERGHVCPICGRITAEPYEIRETEPQEVRPCAGGCSYFSQYLQIVARCRHCSFETRMNFSPSAWGDDAKFQQAKARRIGDAKRQLTHLWPLKKEDTKVLPLTTEQIELSLARHFNYRRNIIVPNVSWGLNLHECDLLVVTRTGYATEIEIKVSVADMRADLKKAHQHRSQRIKKLFYAVPASLKEKILPLVPERAGLLTIEPQTYAYRVLCVKEALAQAGARAFNAGEMQKLTELGALRIWDLKERLHNVKTFEHRDIFWCDDEGPIEARALPAEDESLGGGEHLLEGEQT